MARPYGGHYLTEERKKVVEENMYFLWYYYKKHVTSRWKNLTDTEQDDIIECLHWGICLAAEAWDPDRGKFSTVCKLHFKSIVTNYFRERKLFYGRYQLTPFIYDAKISDSMMATENFSLVKKGGTVSRVDIERNNNRVKWEDILFLLERSGLNSFEERLIYLKYQDGLTLEDIGKIYGYSRERIRQFLKIATEKIHEFAFKSGLTILDFMEN